MNKRERIASAQVGPATVVRLPYLGNASMIVILPTNNGDLSAALKQLSPSDINNARFGMFDTQLSVPKFKLEVQYDLLKELHSLGLTKLRDLDNMADDPRRLHIDQAIHKAVVNVDEKGTTAAAVTVIGISFESVVMPQPRVIKIDRPFAFVIRDDLTGVHLFTGRVNQL